ncbi:hypothetical protein BJ875DRAFT_482977 [Amylocarpus encephaloides]|uniref:Uncharacterized protein n=1 Tax=Amylocarpus encephaloides TaxID=45428 RepID=A0A9P7YM06_9HELO|nr:hypothetical protein BJ875DRAFT_482977 [Amylocarpus encephaloides]
MHTHQQDPINPSTERPNEGNSKPTAKKMSADMDIVHVTYEQVHGSSGGLSAEPTTPTKRAKGNVFGRLSGRTEKGEVDGKLDEISRKALPKQSPRKSGDRVRMRDEKGRLSYPVRTPDLRRKGPFLNPDTTDFEQLYEDQKKIREGKMERVERPSRPNRPADLGLLGLPRSNPVSRAASPVPSRKHGHRKTKSASKRFADYVRTSADVLDETRRDFAGIFSPQFDHFTHAPFSFGRRNSTDSLKSFYCAGESDELANKPSLDEICSRPIINNQPTKQRELLRSPKKAQRPRCRLCRTGSESSRGLCASCEHDHVRPISDLPDLGGDSASEGEVKPIPPPKDLKYLGVNKGQSSRPSTSRTVDSTKPEGQISFGCVPKGQLVITPTLDRQHSIPILIVGENDQEDDLRYETWKNSVMIQKEKDRAQSDPSTWATCYGSSDFEYFERVEPNVVRPLTINKENDAGDKSRDTSFYRFYDDILRSQQ